MHTDNVFDKEELANIIWPKVLFVTGIGTDVGKSYATGWLARELRKLGKNCITQKMIQTGNKEMSEDIDVHRKIMGTGYFPEDYDHSTAPVILSYPASPDLAARIDKVEIDFDAISDATDMLEEFYNPVLIEGAGGLMVPLKNDYLTADYIRDHSLPVVVTVGGQLGSINLSLLTLNAIETYNLNLFGVIYNPHFDKDKIICADTREYLRNWLLTHFPSAHWIDMPFTL